MRVSDTERQRVIDELRRHCAAGRLDVDEYAIRIESAMSASTLAELDGLLSDLPLMRIADPAARLGDGSILKGLGAGRGPRFAASRADSRAGHVITRITASALVLLTVLVVVLAVALALALSWGWAAILVVGWLVGLAQGRLARARH